MDWTQLVGTLGFPIVACIALAVYVKYLTDKYLNAISKMQEEHKAEIAKVTDALNNNTMIVQRLYDKMCEGSTTLC